MFFRLLALLTAPPTHGLDKTGNLPDIPVDSIIVNPNDAHQVYAGTDWGVYYTDDITRCLSNMAALRERYSARDGMGHAN